jgi:TRAP-type mannitol/chloroaromatic compound transport system permease small subunit
MKFLFKVSVLIDTLNGRIGRSIKWLVLAAVVLSAGNAVARRVFAVGSTGLVELQWYLFAALFLLGGGYAFLRNVHVRVDFISTRLTARGRSWIDIIGILFFLTPFCLLLIQLSWPLFIKAVVSGEMSSNAGGLIRWPVFFLVPLGMFLLLLQSASELIKRIAFLRGLIPDPLGHSQAGKDTPVAKPAGNPPSEDK